MSNRLDQETEARLQPIRMESCRNTLKSIGYKVRVEDHTLLTIVHPTGILIKLYPYSGWWSGKKIGSGRGFKNLLNKLKTLEKKCTFYY